MEILFYLLVFFWIDGISTFAGQSVAIASVIGSRFRAVEGARIWLPFWPDSALFLCGRLPVDVTLEGVTYVLPLQTWRKGTASPNVVRIPYCELETVEADQDRLRLNGVSVARCASHEAATGFADLIRRMQSKAPDAREVVLAEFLASSLNRHESANRILRCRKIVRPLRRICALQFVILFGLLPLTIQFGASWAFFSACIGLAFLLHGMIVLLHVRASRQLGHAKTSRLAVLILYPPAALHAGSEYLRHCASTFHPLVVAAAFLSPERLLAQAQRELDRTGHPDWLHPQLAGDRPSEDRFAVLRVHRSAILRGLEACRLPLAEVGKPRTKRSANATAFCPLCDAEYASGFSMCSTCRVPLSSWSV